MHPREWTGLRPAGIHVAPAGVTLDPAHPVDTAVITHGHSDHARAGHRRVIATPETLEIMACRYGTNFCEERIPLGYNTPMEIGDAVLELVPAGHVLGSAQARFTHGGQALLVTGDYKIRDCGPACVAYQPRPCDLLVTEATFALPVFKHPPLRSEITRLLDSVERSPDRCHLVGAYALGKAQHLIAALRQAGYSTPLYLHGALVPLTRLHERLGFPMGKTIPVSEVKDRKQLAGEIVIAPPGALRDRWAARFPAPKCAMASGWMQIRARARQNRIELPLVISDHCDWPQLTESIVASGASEVWITHGREDALMHWAKKEGIHAVPLSLQTYGEEPNDL